MIGYLFAAASCYVCHYGKHPMHQGVMTQVLLAVKQWHMAKLHNIKHFGDCASLVSK